MALTGHFLLLCNFFFIAHCFQQSFKQIISIKTTLKRAYLQNSRYTVHRSILYWCFWSHPQDWFEYQPYIISLSNTQYSIKTHIKTKIKTKTTTKKDKNNQCLDRQELFSCNIPLFLINGFTMGLLSMNSFPGITWYSTTYEGNCLWEYWSYRYRSPLTWYSIAYSG